MHSPNRSGLPMIVGVKFQTVSRAELAGTRRSSSIWGARVRSSFSHFANFFIVLGLVCVIVVVVLLGLMVDG